VRPGRGKIHLVIDATGLKVFGQGEWARAKHGFTGAHAGWRKLHLGVDGKRQVLTAELTDSDVADASAFPGLLRRVRDPVRKATTDGSYDRRHVWELTAERGARAVIPLRRGARLWRMEKVGRLATATFGGSPRSDVPSGDENRGSISRRGPRTQSGGSSESWVRSCGLAAEKGSGRKR
jgi:hypothetical protein